MSSTNKKQSNFLVQGSILAMASIISRIIGLLYRIPMTDIIGDVGNNYYAAAFDIYNVMLIISSYSLPLAVSKLVASSIAKRQRKMAYKILKGALLFAFISGSIVALIVYFGAEFFTNTILKTPNSIFALWILAPALIIVAVLGVIRGFFQGLGNMIPSAISQIIEQIVNAIVSVWAAYVLFNMGRKAGAVLGNSEKYAAAYGAAGGTLGTNIGSVAALLFMVFILLLYMTIFKRQMRRERNVKVESFGYIMKMIVITILPVLLSTAVYNISGIVDQSIFKNIALLQGYTESDIDVWWGVFAGKYKVLINVPISIASAIAASSVPTLTASFGKQDYETVRKQINSAMHFVMVVSFPSAVGLAVLGGPIIRLLFPSTVASIDIATEMMLLGSVAVIFYSMSTLSNGLLQGINKLKIPVINAIIALITHVILLIALMLFFRMSIAAVVIANSFFALIMCFLNARAVQRYSGYKQEVLRTFVIPGICSLIMGAIAFLIYKGLMSITNINSISFVIAFIFAVIVYAVSLIMLKGINEEELLAFPKGQSLVNLSKKLHLLK